MQAMLALATQGDVDVSLRSNVHHGQNVNFVSASAISHKPTGVLTQGSNPLAQRTKRVLA